MRYHLFGRSGLRVSELFLGAMTYEDRGTLDRMLDVYLDAGGNVVDTASAYGDSEAFLGELLGPRRDRLVLATKYTLSRDRTDPNAGGNHRRSLRRSLDESLRLLRTDHVDLLWVHLWDPHTPLEETMRALDDEVRAGRVLYVGFSDAPAWVVARANTLAEWRGWSPFVGVQIPYSLRHRDAERELLPMADALGLSVAAWGPLAGGALSGKFLDGRAAASGRVDPTTLGERDHAAARAVVEVAAELGHTPAEVATAWLRAHRRTVHPIVGSRTVEQLQDSLGAARLDLPADAVARLETAAPFAAGHLADFIAESQAHPLLLGDVADRLEPR